MMNTGSNFTHLITSPYGRQWVKMCHISWEQVMINLVAFICDWVRISFKTFEMSPYFNNHLILCFFKVSNFLWQLSTHMLDTKVLSPPFPYSYRTWATGFSRYYRLLSLKLTTANFNYYTFFSFWQLYSATNVWQYKTFLGVNVKT